MKKILVPLMMVSGLAVAADLDMNNLYCGDLKIDSATTLKQVTSSCKDEKQKSVTYGYYMGMYEVKFVNTATNKNVKCDFPESGDSALINGCR